MKPDLRREARALLATIPTAERERAGAAIAASVWEVAEVAGAGTLLVYAALPSEVPTSAIVSEARRREITIVYPRCIPSSRELTLHSVEDEDELVAGSFGVLEPAINCPLVPISAVEAALVPGLLWDRKGGRLGRGAGYYDRLLGGTEWRAFACGLFHSIQESSLLPTDPWDVRLDAVVTESEIWRPDGERHRSNTV